MTFAGRITALRTPLHTRYWRGFLFLFEVFMDIIEAKQNLKKLHEDKDKILSLNHLNSTQAFRFECDKRVRQIDGNIETIRQNIKRYGH